jgi:chromosome partitioning protein
MRSIAVINQKGGVGKTTTAVNLAAALALSGQRVCLVDLDPQAHATLHWGHDVAAGERSVYDVLVGEAFVTEVARTIRERIALVPSSIDLAGAELELVSKPGRETRLSRGLAQVELHFDYVIFDCPPSLGLLTLNALVAAREVILPLQPHFLALHGMCRMLRTMELLGQRLNPQLVLAGVVLCMFDSTTRMAAEVTDEVATFLAGQRRSAGLWRGAQLFHTRIRRNVRLAEAPSHGESIFGYAPQSPGAEDYRNLAREVLAMAAAPATGLAQLTQRLAGQRAA